MYRQEITLNGNVPNKQIIMSIKNRFAFKSVKEALMSERTMC